MIKLPMVPTQCSKHDCPYNSGVNHGFICDEPEINNGNSDALCHEWNYLRLYNILVPKYNTAGGVLIPQQY